MAKKKTASRKFTLAKETKNVLQENPNLSGKQVIELLKKRFPTQKINENSAQVAFSNARRDLGLSTTRSKKMRGSVSGKDGGSVDILVEARDFVESAGGTQAAIDVIRRLESLQLN